MSRPWRRIRWRSVLPAILLALSGSGLLAGCGKQPPRVSHRVSRAMILPREVHVEVGKRVKLEALIMDRKGEGIAVDDPRVSWSGTGPDGKDLEFSGAYDTYITLTIPTGTDLGGDVSRGPFEVKAEITYGDARGRVVAEPAHLFVTRKTTNPGMDYLDPPFSSGALPTLTVLDFVDSYGVCHRDAVLASAGRAYLNENAVAGCPARDGRLRGPEVAVFPSDRLGGLWDRSSLQGYVQTPSDPLWDSDLGDGFTGFLGPGPSFEVRFWNGTGQPPDSIRHRSKLHFEWAQAVMVDSRVGVGLSRDPTIRPVAAGISPLRYWIGWCTKEGPYKAILGPGEDVTKRVINVLYVEALTWYLSEATSLPGGPSTAGGTPIPPLKDEESVAPLGMACRWAPGVAGAHLSPLIIIDYDNGSWGVLAHELGHLFGLNSDTSIWTGHTHNRGDFKCWNTMDIFISAECPGNRVRFSLGQSYRMQVDPRASLLTGWGSPRLKRDCGDEDKDMVAGVCPSISLDIWPHRR